MSLTYFSSKKNWFLGAGFLIAAIGAGGTFLDSSGPGAPALERINHPSAMAPRADGASRTDQTDLKRRVSEAYGQLPLTFESNRGQTDSRVDFVARGRGYMLFLTSTEAVFSLSRDPKTGNDTLVDTKSTVRPHDQLPSRPESFVRMQLVGSTPRPRVAGRDELPGKAHYFLGNDPTKWRTNVPTFARVHYANVYPGIDLTFYGNQRQLEYDFIVRPGADPRGIALQFKGADAVELDATGDLVLRTPGGAIRQHAPQIYQDIDGRRRAVSGGYVLRGPSTVEFDVGAYDVSRALVIDPTLVYSTYLGGSSFDTAMDIAVDATGSAYVTGFAVSRDFPTTPGAFDTTFNRGGDAFVTKLDPSGSALVYSTYLGGSGSDAAQGIAVDAAGSVYVTGGTSSADFPTTAGAFDTTFNGQFDGFVTKLDAAGSALVYSTYLGGSSFDGASSIAVDAAGSAYVTGRTDSANFPTTPGALDPMFNGSEDAFVTKLNAAGSAPLLYSTYLGGTSFDTASSIAVDAAGSAYVAGQTGSADFPTTPGAFDTTLNDTDAFVTKLNPAGSAPPAYSTYLGGTGFDGDSRIAVDAADSAYVTGTTSSADFPTTAGAFDTTLDGSSDAFVTKLNAAGSAPLLYSTYLGGSSSTDQSKSIAVDATGSAYVVGLTFSADFPTTSGAFDTTLNGTHDAFVTKLNAAGSAPLMYSTFLGGSSGDQALGVAVDAAGSAYVTGLTESADFPTTPGAFDTTLGGGVDAFVAKIAGVGPPATLTLTPPAASNPVETQHCVTATVQDVTGNPVPNITVRFRVTGAVNTSGSATTDANGQATFCYQGPPLPGADAITAFADTDNDGIQDPGEPSGAATKTWTLPVTTPLCEIRITNGGWIIATNGDRASFGGNARANESGETSGQQEYQDHGPAQPINVHSINVLAIVCEGDTRASIFGQATVNGSGSFTYRIRVQDLAEPGVGHDTYWILLQTGYNSGEQMLQGGNVQIRRP